MKKIKILEFEKPIQGIEDKIYELSSLSDGEIDFSAEVDILKAKRSRLIGEIYANLNPWQITQVARHPDRPYFTDYMELIADEFIEIHGDRNFADDQSIITGFATIGGNNVVVIGQQKGRNTDENIARNFGMSRPEGYRKALRVMKLAEKFHRPILTFIDTPGAYPGIEAEERGQGEAIARNLMEMAALEIPLISTIIGEGGSGGALGIAVSDKILIMENSIYSVISPEGCASILWRDASKASVAAEALNITSGKLLKFGLVDEIVAEPKGGAHRDIKLTAANLKKALLSNLATVKKIPKNKLVAKREEKFRKMGPVLEG